MLPIQNKIPNDDDYKFNYDQVEKAVYNHFEIILKENKLDSKIVLQILEINSSMDYSEYTIIFKDITCHGNNKPILKSL